MMNEILLNIQIKSLEEGGYLATSEDLQGLVAQGRTVAETREIAQDVARKLIESYLEHGDPLPPRVRAALKQRRRKMAAKIPIGLSSEVRKHEPITCDDLSGGGAPLADGGFYLRSTGDLV